MHNNILFPTSKECLFNHNSKRPKQTANDNKYFYSKHALDKTSLQLLFSEFFSLKLSDFISFPLFIKKVLRNI